MGALEGYAQGEGGRKRRSSTGTQQVVERRRIGKVSVGGWDIIAPLAIARS